jgi:hypothetical protein
MRSETNTPSQACFSANLESVRKDVECVFGILKERWSCLQNGFKFWNIKICQQLFVTCCVLHNMMLDEMMKDDSKSKIGRGVCLPNDGIWLAGHTPKPVISTISSNKTKELSIKFHERRSILATHLNVWQRVSKE